MILTCPQCQSQYNLDDQKLGAGRTVRCVSCKHAWYQTPEGIAASPPPSPAPPPPPPETGVAVAPAESPPSIQEAFDTILKQDEATFENMLSAAAQDAGVNAEASPPSPPPPPPKKRAPPPSVITHNPFGVSANAFGGLVFLLLVSLTFAALFTMQKPFLHRWPQMALMYNAIGLGAPVPGEGLRIEELTAARGKNDEGADILDVKAKMTNMTRRPLPFPPLYVSVKDADGKTIKDWKLKSRDKKIAGEETVPMILKLPQPPPGGDTVEVRVHD